MTILHNPIGEWRRLPLPQAALVLLQVNGCPDCKNAPSLVPGPRGGMAQNMACCCCGSEFNVVRRGDSGEDNGTVIMAHRNSRPGDPNRARLAQVYGIEIAPVRDTAPE